MSEQLQKSIIQTLAYWDIFERPLTSLELFNSLLIYRYLDLQITFDDFLIELDKLTGLPGAMERSRGFYFLSGRKEIVARRLSKVKIMEKKMKIAIKGIKKLAKIPFVRAVFVCNTVASGIADEDSDIDLLVIVKQGRMWFARLVVTITLSLFRLRRTKTKIKNKICLSFYTADSNLNFEKICIEQPDIYFIYWLNNLIPVFDPDDYHQKISEANKWVNKFLLIGIEKFKTSARWSVRLSYFSQSIKNFLEKIWGGKHGDLIEAQAKGIQISKMKMNFNSAQTAGDTRVIISDEMLKFHERDRREEYKGSWEKKCKEILNK